MKFKVWWIVFGSIFLIVFNILFFTLLGKTIDTADMISYGFITLSYIILVLTFVFVKKDKKINVSLNLSIYYISIIYFIVEFLIGVSFLARSNSALISMIFKYIVNTAKGSSVIVGFFIGFIEKAEVIGELQEVATKFPSPILAFVTQLLLLLLYFVLLMPIIIANKVTIKNVEERNVGINYIKEETSKVFSLVNKVSNRNIKKELEKLYDELRASPIKTFVELSDIENNIKNKIKNLESIINSNDNEKIINEIVDVLNCVKERNNRIKLL